MKKVRLALFVLLLPLVLAALWLLRPYYEALVSLTSGGAEGDTAAVEAFDPNDIYLLAAVGVGIVVVVGLLVGTMAAAGVRERRVEMQQERVNRLADAVAGGKVKRVADFGDSSHEVVGLAESDASGGGGTAGGSFADRRGRGGAGGSES